MTEYVVARKRVTSEGQTYWPGDVVPGAEGWKTLRALTGSGVLAPVEDDEAAAPSIEEGVADLSDDVVVAGAEVPDLGGMDKQELRDLAESLGIDVPGRISKANLLDLLTGP